MKWYQQQKGITLVELILSIAIFTIITAMVIFGFIDSGKHTDLRLAADQVESNLRQLQSAAISGQEVAGAVPGGFGISLDLTSANKRVYLTYGDTTSFTGGIGCVIGTNQRYDYPDLGGAGNCRSPQEEELVLNQFRLPGLVELAKVYIGGTLVSDRADITFTTPEAMVHARYNAAGSWFDPINTDYIGQTATDQSIILCLYQPQVSLYRKITVIGLTGQVNVGDATGTCLP